MANNCLVTKLRGVVDNDNLLKLTEFKFKVRNDVNKASEQVQIMYYINDAVGRIIGNGTASNLAASNYHPITATKGEEEFYIALSPKTRLKYIYLSPSSTSLFLFDLKDLEYLSIEELKLNYGAIGDVKYLSKITNLKELRLQMTSCTGQLSSIGTLVNLNLINIYGSSIQGGVDDLAQSMVSNGRTSGTLSFTGRGSGTAITVKFGETMENPTAEEIAQGYQIS